MQFNEKLYELRKEKNLSQEELAYKLNVARQTVSKWEVGTTTPDMDNLINISKVFEISIDELVGNEFLIEDDVVKEENVITKTKKNFDIIKIIILYVSILILGIVILFSALFYKRYQMLGKFEEAIKDMKNKNEYGFWSGGHIYDNLNITEEYYNDYIVKDDIMIINKYKSNFDKNTGYNISELVFIEYRNKDILYEIDVLNKMYTKKEYNQGKEGFYNFTGIELESAFLKEFEMYDKKTKMKLALSLNVKIIEHINPDGFVWYEIEKIEKEDSKIVKKSTMQTTYMSNKPGLRFAKIEYLDAVKNVSEAYEFGEDRFTDEKLQLPDLIEYTLVDNNEI